jgi:integrase
VGRSEDRLAHEPTERRERLSWGSIANLANTLRAFLRYCAGLGAVESVPEIKNPSAKQLAGDRAYLRPLDSDERGAFLWALAVEGEARALRIYIALFETWMRKGALAAMTPRWVNFAQERIKIPSAYTKAQRGDLEIDLTPRAAEAIRAEMGDTVELDAPIFGAFDYRALFPRIAEVAGIDLTGLTAHHVTRRTAATLAGEKPGASLAALKSQGGWRTSARGRRLHAHVRRGGAEGYPMKDWSVRAGDPCDVCGEPVVTACLPCEVKYCEKHYRPHGNVCPRGPWPEPDPAASVGAARKVTR